VRRALLLALLLLPATAAAQGTRTTQRPPAPYSVHDIRLGTTLASFRELERWRDLPSGARLACSDEKSEAGETVRPSADMQAAGAIRCAAVAFLKDRFVEQPLEFFGQSGNAGFVFYKREKEPDYRLAQVNLAFDNKYFNTVLNTFRRAYGQPTNFDVNSVTTLFGASLSNATYEWSNSVSTIRMDTFAVTIERMSVMFAHNELWVDLGQNLRAVRDAK
jgi:hypothetical protein